jgi:recombination protein RecT
MSTQKLSVQGLLENKDTLKRMQACLPRHLTPERMIRIAVTEYSRNHALKQCDPLSFVSAVMEAAQLGLEPASSLHYAYLVPYAGKVKLMIGYRGFIALVRRHPDISNVYAHAVYEGDEFDYELGTEMKLTHKPKGQSEDLTHVYAVAVFKDGTKEFIVMSRREVEKIRDRFSRKDKNGKFSDAWVDSFDEMAKKTVIRRFVKTLPMSNELERALENNQGTIIDVESEDATQGWIELQEQEPNVTKTQVQIASTEATTLIQKIRSYGLDTENYQSIIDSGDERKIIAVTEVMRKTLADKEQLHAEAH